MKYILLIPIVLQLNISLAQDTPDELDDKPSWSEELPEMHDTPDISLDSNVDTDIDYDIDKLRMDRDSLFEDSEIENPIRPDFDLEDQVDSDQYLIDTGIDSQPNQEKAAEEQIKAEKIAAEKEAADKVVAEKLAAEKVAAEKLAAEKLAAEKKAAEKLAAEKKADDKLAAEKIAQEQERITAERLAKQQADAVELAKEKATTDAEVEQSTNERVADENTSSQSNQKAATYKWLKIKDSLPKYPLRAARSAEDGWVDVEIEINPYGDVVSATVLRSYRNARTFRRSATDAAKEWKFDPPLNYGIQENQFKSFKILFKL